MARIYRIRVSGKRRRDIDLAAVAQVVVLLSRRLAQQERDGMLRAAASDAAAPDGGDQPHG